MAKLDLPNRVQSIFELRLPCSIVDEFFHRLKILSFSGGESLRVVQNESFILLGSDFVVYIRDSRLLV